MKGPEKFKPNYFILAGTAGFLLMGFGNLLLKGLWTESLFMYGITMNIVTKLRMGNAPVYGFGLLSCLLLAVLFTGCYRHPKSNKLIKAASLVSIAVMIINLLYYVLNAVYYYKDNQIQIAEHFPYIFGYDYFFIFSDIPFRVFLPLNILISAAIVLFIISLLLSFKLNLPDKILCILMVVLHGAAVVVGIGTFVWEPRLIFVWNRMGRNFYIVNLLSAFFIVIMYIVKITPGFINALKAAKKTRIERVRPNAKPVIAAVAALMVLITGALLRYESVRVHADNLMKGVRPQKVGTVELSREFIQSTADFSIELFKKAHAKGENSLVSPTSVYLALGMTANGAGGNTLKEFETLLGGRSIDISQLNAYYNSLSANLTDVKNGKVSIADSIWFSEELHINKDFLQTNADYYNAAAYMADFSSMQTMRDINKWVKANTGKKIDKIVDELDTNIIMCLINAIYFEAEWEEPYKKQDVYKNTFTLENGSEKTVDFMNSHEEIYLKDDNAEGFIKPYKDGKYSFVTLLPNQGTDIDSYVASLTGEGFINLLENQSKGDIAASLPRFESEYSIDLVEALKAMGLKDCFNGDSADFSAMISGSGGNLSIGEVRHKTYISVDTKGTKAGAVTAPILLGGRGLTSIVLNRPFVYAIVDNKTKLPLFIGTLMDPNVK